LRKLSQILTEDKNVFALVSTKPRRTASSEKALAAPKTPGKPRNYGKEATVAQESLFEDFATYRQRRAEGDTGSLIQIAQALVLCGLPYRKTDKREITRYSRAADGAQVRVTFYALGKEEDGTPIPMPYGSDRMELHFAIDQAIKRNDPFVPLGTGVEYMKAVGQARSGKNYKRLRDAHRRLSGLSIMVERFNSDSERRGGLMVFADSQLPKSLAPGTLPMHGQLGIRLGNDFFEEIISRHVPFPIDLLLVLKLKPQMMDIVTFLHLRSYAARSVSNISWESLRAQLWQEDSNPRRIRTRFAQAIKIFKVAWPELNAFADLRYLRIGPPKNGQHLIPAYRPRLAKEN